MSKKNSKGKKNFVLGEVKTIGNNIVVVASDETKDRHGEVIKVDGWDFKNFKKNPTMLIGHDYQSLPVGKWNNIKVDKNQLVVEPQFADTDRGREVRELVNSGILPAVSVGFSVKERDDEDESVITKAELLEISWVSVPANPNALMRALEKGYSFKMEKPEEMKKQEELLKHYKEIVKDYRKSFKDIREELKIEINKEGEKIEEGKQVDIITNQIVNDFKELNLQISEKETPTKKQKQKETPEASDEEAMRKLMPLIMEQVQEELKNFI